MRNPLALSLLTVVTAVCALLAGCASTTVTLTPSHQTPVCDNSGSALVLWAPQWRPDQKDVKEREVAAETGLKEFLQSSGCFARFELRRLPNMKPAVVAANVSSANGQFNKVVTVTLHELGPVIKLFSSLALINGGTEVMLQIAEYLPHDKVWTRMFTVRWQNGGPGVIKGVTSLPQDMQAALVIGLRPIRPEK